MAHHQEHDPLGDLAAQGVAVWLDDLSRELLATGRLQALIEGRHVVGVTTNPTIFAAALSNGDRYTEQLQTLARAGADVDAAVFAVTTDDVRSGCDVLAPVHQRTAGLDGRVSIEVDPRLSRDATATAEMARTLWTAVDRDNLFIKIPATREGLTAITESIGQGISVNVTLIFSLDRYRAVMDAYLDGLERAHAAGRDLSALHSVASFFVSRVDTEVDSRLDRIGTPEATALKGSAAIANARLAYQAYQEVTAGPRWQRLARHGARPQRPLWASTGVKDPAYPDTMYVTELVARDTVNTMPGPTLEAFADHGAVRGDTVTGSYHAAAGVLDRLAVAGVDFDDVTDQLERDGLAKFESSWSELSDTVSAQLKSTSNEADADRAGRVSGTSLACSLSGATKRCRSWMSLGQPVSRHLRVRVSVREPELAGGSGVLQDDAGASPAGCTDVTRLNRDLTHIVVQVSSRCGNTAQAPSNALFLAGGWDDHRDPADHRAP